MKFIAAVIAVLLGASVPVRATLITFDDLPDSFPGSPIPDGYNGVTWNNFYELDGANINAYYGVSASGYANGVVSPNNVAFNNFGNAAFTYFASPFNMVSGYFTAAFNNNLNLSIQGWNDDTLVYNQNFTLSALGPQFIMLNINNVTEVDFSSSGGYNAGLNYGSGTQFVLDNLTITAVPEPASVALAGMGGLSIWLFPRRRK